MPIPWLTVLQSVPWTDVVRNAPKLADGAKKLWSAIGKQPPVAESPGHIEHAAEQPEDPAIKALQSQLAAVEASVADLHEQMLASSELIKGLAEQNTQLIQRIETNRVRVLWLTGMLVLTSVVALSALAIVLLR